MLTLLVLLYTLLLDHCRAQDLPLRFGDLISEAPYDPMGRDFRNSFSTKLIESNANPDNMMFLANAVFAERFEIAYRYDTFFARQMRPVAYGVPIQR